MNGKMPGLWNAADCDEIDFDRSLTRFVFEGVGR